MVTTSEKSPPEMSYNQFASLMGLTSDYEVQAHIHGGLMAAHMPNSYHRRYNKKLIELQTERESGKVQYQKAIKDGLIVAPQPLARIEALRERANGHPDLKSTQAAIRLLARYEQSVNDDFKANKGNEHDNLRNFSR